MERGEVEGRGGECARLEAEPSPELYLRRASLALARHELQPGGLGCSGRAQKSREQRPRVRAGGEITGAAPHPLACQLQEPTKRDIRKGPDTDAETAPSLPPNVCVSSRVDRTSRETQRHLVLFANSGLWERTRASYPAAQLQGPALF